MGGRCPRCEAKDTAQEEGDGLAPTVHSFTDEHMPLPTIQSLTDEQASFKEVPMLHLPTASLEDIQQSTAITWCSQCACEGSITADKQPYESDALVQVTYVQHDSAIPASEATTSELGTATKESEIASSVISEVAYSGEDCQLDQDGDFTKSTSSSSDSSSSGESEVSCYSDVSGASRKSLSSIRSVVEMASKLGIIKIQKKVSERTKKVKTKRFIQEKLEHFRQGMLVTAGPGEADRDRGVYIEELYDFYDPVSCKVRKRKMGDDVVHRRAKGAAMKKLSSVESGCSDVTALSDRSGSTYSVVSVASSSCSIVSRGTKVFAPALSSLKETLVRQAKKRRTNKELVADWAYLVGKMLHSLIIDFSAMMDKAIREKRYLAASQLSRNSGGKIRDAVQERAGFVVHQAMKLAKELKQEPKDQLDKEWRDRDILPYLFSTEYVDTLLLLARGAAKVLAKQSTVETVLAPCHVFGDIHGQLRDLLLLFACFGSPSPSGKTTFVFNGDFVDRGAHQIEVVGLLFALKLWMPDKVVLVRGNHEDRTMNERYGFKDACRKHLGNAFGKTLFERVHQAFDELPLACLIEQKVLCVHGGLGDGTWTLEQLRTVRRPIKDLLSSSEFRWIADILWSDPIEDGKQGVPEVFGVHESPRGKVGGLFAWDITKTFCARNGVSLIVRSHQSKEGSPGFDVMHENKLVRVFSARDYEDHGNDGAILTITKQSDGFGKDLLTIKPKVLRSVTKARDEAHRHKKEKKELRKVKCQVNVLLPLEEGSTSANAKQERRPPPKSPSSPKSLKSPNTPKRISAEMRHVKTEELLAPMTSLTRRLVTT